MLTKKEEEHDTEGQGSAHRPPHSFLLGRTVAPAADARASSPCGCVRALNVTVVVVVVSRKQSASKQGVGVEWGSKRRVLILFFLKKKAGVPKKIKLCPTISLRTG
jgi:hypothetical protein